MKRTSIIVLQPVEINARQTDWVAPHMVAAFSSQELEFKIKVVAMYFMSSRTGTGSPQLNMLLFLNF